MNHRLTVLLSTPEPRPTTNPYIVMLQRALQRDPDVDLLTFSWRDALSRKYDVFHVHWPEILVGGHSPVKKLVRQLLTGALLLRLRLRRTPVVRTVHNLELPSGISHRERFLLRVLDRQTTFRILLNSETELPDNQASATIPHGHYRDWFADLDRSAVIPGRLGFVGMVRRYKGVEKLISSFVDARAGDENLSLHIGGAASTPNLEREMTSLAAGDDRIRLSLHFLPDSELVDIVTSSELVVLPYRFMHNSGGTLAALSLDRPVLVPDNAVNRALAEEVGRGWVWRYSREIDSAAILAAIDQLRAQPPGVGPNLDKRGWEDAGRSHTDAYRRAILMARHQQLKVGNP